MSHNLLLVEDSPHKRTQIMNFLESIQMELDINEVCSYSSARRAIAEKNFSVILLDMSLPTYDKSDMSSGGKFRPFGGWELAHRIFREQPNAKVIFITQYQSFSDTTRTYSFESLRTELLKEDGRNYGMIFFDNSKSAWKEELAKLLEEIIQ